VLRSKLLSPAVALLVSGIALAAFSLTYSHLAGSDGGPGFEDATGGAARFNGAQNVAFDTAGNLYVADTGNHTIRKISASGVVTTLAGLAEEAGFEDGHGANARFRSPRGLVVDASGNVFVADTGNHCIRRITPDGVVTTLAGMPGVSGFLNDTGTLAKFSQPTGITLAGDGHLYVADSVNHAIRRVTVGGVVTTFAGTGSFGSVNGTGTGASFNTPLDIEFNAAAAALFVTDTGNHVVRRIMLATAAVTTFAGTMGVGGNESGAPGKLTQPQGIASDPGTATLYVTHAIAEVVTIDAGGTIAPFAGVGFYPGPEDGLGGLSRFNDPRGVAWSPSAIYVADSGNHTVRRVELTPAVVTTFAGEAMASGFVNATGDLARFNNPSGVAIYPGPPGFGFAYVADTNNHAIRRVGMDGVVTTLSGGTFGYQEGASARFRSPRGVAMQFSAQGVYVADTGNHVIRHVTAAGVASLVAGQPFSAGSDNGDAFSLARFNSPQALALHANVLYVADTGNRKIRRIDLDTDVVTTLAGTGGFGLDDGPAGVATFTNPTSIMIDGDSDLIYVTDDMYIRRITLSGDVTTIAGSCCFGGPTDGTGSAARFGYPGPTSISGDFSGDAVIADPTSHVMRRITLATGEVSTDAGRPNTRGSSPGTGEFARFDLPTKVSELFDSLVLTQGHGIRQGGPEIADRATIDSNAGAVGTTRQLNALPINATSWKWEVIRRPSGSTATLSSTTVRNPTFTPDVADVYVFRCTATGPSGSSISTVKLQASGAATTLDALYPGPQQAGVSFEMTVRALDQYGVVADGYRGTVHFSSSDPSADLPANYTYTAGDHGSRTFEFTLNTVGVHSITATDVANPSLSSVTTIIVQLAPPPVVATATSTTGVHVSWTASEGATGYDIGRRAPGSGGWVIIATNVSGTSLTDTVPADGVYFYRARARMSSGTSAWGTPDIANTFAFFDDPVVIGGFMRAIHVGQLRQAVNAARSAAGLTLASFTDPTVAAAVTRIKAVHVTELRTRLNQARAATGMAEVTFTDPVLNGLPPKVVHINQLRDALK
jgi:sugar lactone lactonase YvrE